MLDDHHNNHHAGIAQAGEAVDHLRSAINNGTLLGREGMIHAHSHGHRGSENVEAQGPISWAGGDLGLKYRGEAERESAWEASQQAQAASAQLHNAANVFFATAEVLRHPMVLLMNTYLVRENERSQIRARGRAMTRRFVLDVHQVMPRGNAEG